MINVLLRNFDCNSTTATVYFRANYKLLSMHCVAYTAMQELKYKILDLHKGLNIGLTVKSYPATASLLFKSVLYS